MVLTLGIAAPVAGQEGKKPDFNTTAEELSKEFIKDAAAAGKKYQGKTIEVEGIVVAAVKASDRGTVVTLQGAKKAEKDLFSIDVACGIPGKGKDEALKLKEGERVVFQGNFLFGTASRVNLGDGNSGRQVRRTRSRPLPISQG